MWQNAGIASFKILEGSYSGNASHANGSTFHVSYQVKHIATESGDVYCIWISRNDSISLQARCPLTFESYSVYSRVDILMS